MIAELILDKFKKTYPDRLDQAVDCVLGKALNDRKDRKTYEDYWLIRDESGKLLAYVGPNDTAFTLLFR